MAILRPAEPIAAAPSSGWQYRPLSGLVLFDDPNSPTTGRIFLPGQAAGRFYSVAELPTGVLWFSNVTEFEGLGPQFSRLRSSSFYGPSLHEVAQDLALPIERGQTLSDDSAQRVCSEFAHALVLAAEIYGEGDPERWIRTLQVPYLAPAIARSLPTAPSADGAVRAGLEKVFANAYQHRSVPAWDDWAFDGKSRFVTLRFNRLAYARQIFLMQVPSGKHWVHIEGTAGRNVLAELAARPSFVRAEVRPTADREDVTASTVAAIGHSGDQKPVRRSWFAQPEALWMSEFSEIDVQGFYVDDGGMRDLPARAQLPGRLTERPEMALSYAAGLVAHAHWLAMANPRPGAGGSARSPDLWNVWLRAMDRTLMHDVAMRAHEAGLHVESYGDGALRLRVADEQMEAVRRFWDLESFAYPVAPAMEAG